MTTQLNLEPNEVNLVLAGLAELPLKHSLDTWFKVKTAAEAQAAQAMMPPPPEAPAGTAQE